MKVFDDYARYYDLLYRDKDYSGEAEYIHRLIQKHAPQSRTILDLGCGTAAHAEYLIRKGYAVHGVDQSAEMLERAAERLKTMPDQYRSNLSFSQGDIRRLVIDRQFDIVTALFHVVSYLPGNEDLENTFRTAYEHLKEHGIFIFDFWYGPGVLSDPPAVRVKRMEDDYIQVTRIAEPQININKNLVNVDYQIFIREKSPDVIYEIKESHQMRYLFLPELEYMCGNAGFKIEEKLKWLATTEPDKASWNACLVLKK